MSHVKNFTGNDEWYTPRRYLDAAIEVMGAIELDPATSLVAQKHVRAQRFYTLADDGLAQPWEGRVFLNPPYSAPKPFIDKLIEHHEAGDVPEAVLLTNSATDTLWWHVAARGCAVACLVQGRIAFLQERDGELMKKTSNAMGQSFFYFGPFAERFETVFERFGGIVVFA